MRKYCKAYHVEDLRQFSRWTEKHEESEPELSATDIVYLWDDFTVVKSPVTPEKGLVFDSVTPEWQDFCKTALHFEIPEDLRYAYKQTEVQHGAVEEESKASV